MCGLVVSVNARQVGRSVLVAEKSACRRQRAPISYLSAAGRWAHWCSQSALRKRKAQRRPETIDSGIADMTRKPATESQVSS